MRRQFLKSVSAFLVVGPFELASAESHPFPGHRLIGVWRSDKERTLAHWQFKEGLAPEIREKISGWFGTLTHTITRTKITTEFEGQRWTSRYRVLSATENTVTIAYSNPDDRSPHTVYFYENYMLVRVGKSFNFEYFRNIAA